MTKKKPQKTRNKILKIAHTCKVSAMQISLASDIDLVPQHTQNAVKTPMLAAVHAIQTSEKPSIEHWKAVADAVNIMETLLILDAAQIDANIISTAQNSIKNAIARQRSNGGTARLDGPGLSAVKLVVDFVIAAINQLTHKAYLLVLRDTDLRLRLKAQSPKFPEGTVIINKAKAEAMA